MGNIRGRQRFPCIFYIIPNILLHPLLYMRNMVGATQKLLYRMNRKNEKEQCKSKKYPCINIKWKTKYAFPIFSHIVLYRSKLDPFLPTNNR